MNYTQDPIRQQGRWNAVIFIILGLMLLTACDPPGINNNGVRNGNQGNCNGVNKCAVTEYSVGGI